METFSHYDTVFFELNLYFNLSAKNMPMNLTIFLELKIVL